MNDTVLFFKKKKVNYNTPRDAYFVNPHNTANPFVNNEDNNRNVTCKLINTFIYKSVNILDMDFSSFHDR